MPKVLCTLPNASEQISGVKFSAHEAGMLSEEVSDEVAAGFAAIPGYEVVGASKSDAGEDSTEKADLLARAAAINLKTKANWSLERLKSEVEAAEKAATAAE